MNKVMELRMVREGGHQLDLGNEIRRECEDDLSQTYSIGTPRHVHGPHARVYRRRGCPPLPVIGSRIVTLAQDHPKHLVVGVRLALDELNYIG